MSFASISGMLPRFGVLTTTRTGSDPQSAVITVQSNAVISAGRAEGISMNGARRHAEPSRLHLPASYRRLSACSGIRHRRQSHRPPSPRCRSSGQAGIEFLVQLLDLRAAGASLLALIFQRPAAGVIEEKILRRDQPQGPDEIVLEQAERCRADSRKASSASKPIRYILAVKMNAANPTEMVEADIVAANRVLEARQAQRRYDATSRSAYRRCRRPWHCCDA